MVSAIRLAGCSGMKFYELVLFEEGGRISLDLLEIYANVKNLYFMWIVWKYIEPGLVFCAMLKFKRAIQGEADFVIEL